MEEDLRGYQCYWLRIARHIGLSEAGKQLGVRASQLSAFERGNAHNLSEEQIAAYVAWLQSIEVPPPAEDEIEGSN
jgi:transcriptional regulator with XRE-family HTH domain